MIFYFSATGNSKYAAERIAAALDDQALSIQNASPNITLAPGEALGIVTPTNWWQLPVPVRAFLEQLTISAQETPYLFLVATYGSTPGAIAQDARQVLKRRGCQLSAAFGLKMPDNWTPIFDLSDPEAVAATNRAAETQLDALLPRLQAREPGIHLARKTPYFLFPLTNAMLEQGRKTKHLHVEDSCIGCGLCAKKCPVGAIELRDNRPVWVKDRCAMCLGCLHRCPTFAIQYGNGKTKQHGQYQNPHTTV